MKHLRKYESFSEEALYNKWREFIDSLIDIFEEFEDNGWYWSSGSKKGRNKSISLDFWPEFNCIMLNDKDDYIPAQKSYEVDYTGHFKSGEIIWNTEYFNYIEKSDDIEKISEELEDFLVAINRLNDATGVDFSFSYNSKGGELKIVIQGFVKIKI
jgi:hypothetical protein